METGAIKTHPGCRERMEASRGQGGVLDGIAQTLGSPPQSQTVSKQAVVPPSSPLIPIGGPQISLSQGKGGGEGAKAQGSAKRSPVWVTTQSSAIKGYE